MINIYGGNELDPVFPRKQLSFSCGCPTPFPTHPGPTDNVPAWLGLSSVGMGSEKQQVQLPGVHNRGDHLAGSPGSSWVLPSGNIPNLPQDGLSWQNSLQRPRDTAKEPPSTQPRHQYDHTRRHRWGHVTVPR